ncbi:MAG: type II secretion system protein GspL [Xanthomonadales bacterium]|nr:type II secretion system protein GspL [Xanthomonadales bacterium]
MKPVLYIYAAASGAEKLDPAKTWCWLTNEAALQYGSAEQLQQAATKLAESDRVVLVLPSEDVLLTSLNIPAKQAAQIRQAAPFAIEEQLACDPAKLHIVAQRNTATGKVDIAGIERQFLQTCLEQLESLGIQPQQAIADIFILPAPTPGTLILSKQPDTERILLRWGINQGTAMPTALLADWLTLFLQEQDQPAITKLLIASGDHQATLLKSELGDISALEVEQLIVDKNPNTSASINLLSGEFRSNAKRSGQPNWYRSLVLLAAALSLFVMTAFVDTYRDNKQLKNLNTAIEKTFREAFPKVQRIEDPMIQARQQLALLGGRKTLSSGFLMRMSELAGALKPQSAVQINSLDYRNNKLEVKLHAANIGELEALAERIREKGGGAILSSASLGKLGVDARLLLEDPSQ